MGTAFFVGVELKPVDRWAVYAVTARHVIDGTRPRGAVYLRCVPEAGKTRLLECPHDSWKTAAGTDIAIAQIAFNLGDYGLQFLSIEHLATDQFVETWDVGPGDHVVFSGLFAPLFGRQRDRPIMRFGRISMNPEEDISVPSREGVPAYTHRPYLVEARSWSGHSGTPAFIYFTIDRDMFIGDRLNAQLPHPKLLGLVSGHFDVQQQVAFKNDLELQASVATNTGLAMVVPAQKIVDLLQSDGIVEERRRFEEQLEEALRDEDSGGTTLEDPGL